jgi:hypothetical protein
MQPSARPSTLDKGKGRAVPLAVEYSAATLVGTSTSPCTPNLSPDDENQKLRKQVKALQRSISSRDSYVDQLREDYKQMHEENERYVRNHACPDAVGG